MQQVRERGGLVQKRTRGGQVGYHKVLLIWVAFFEVNGALRMINNSTVVFDVVDRHIAVRGQIETERLWSTGDLCGSILGLVELKRPETETRRKRA